MIKNLHSIQVEYDQLFLHKHYKKNHYKNKHHKKSFKTALYLPKFLSIALYFL